MAAEQRATSLRGTADKLTSIWIGAREPSFRIKAPRADVGGRHSTIFLERDDRRRLPKLSRRADRSTRGGSPDDSA